MITLAILIGHFKQISHWTEVGKPLSGINQIWCTPSSDPILVSSADGYNVATKLSGTQLLPWGRFDSDQHAVGIDGKNNLVLLRVNAIQVVSGGTGFGPITCPDFLRLVVRGNYSLLREATTKVFKGQAFEYQALISDPDRSSLALASSTGDVAVVEEEKSAYSLSTFGPKKFHKKLLLAAKALPLEASIDRDMEFLDDRHLLLHVTYDRDNGSTESFLSLNMDVGTTDTIYSRTIPSTDRGASLISNSQGRFASMANGVVAIIIGERLHFFKKES